jgi:hypothetical protein
MKPWIVLFLLVLLAGLIWGLVHDFLSKEQATLKGIVTEIDFGRAPPKSFPANPPHLKVRLADGSLVTVATKNPGKVPVGSEIIVTEWVTPWGQLWYTQRD